MSHAHSRQFTQFRANPNALFKKKTSESADSLPLRKRIGGGWAVLMALGLFALQFGATASSPGQTAAASQGPVSTIVDTVDELIEDLINALDEAEQIATAQATPLSSQEKQTLAARLDEAEALIDDVFNPVVEPNLTPVDAGGISLLYTPLTLADYAEQCVELAQDAKDELLLHGDLFDHELIGTKLKTIRYLISRSLPHNYRSKAGINSAQADLP